MMLPSNPYIAGNPVHGQGKFIGRQDVLRDVEQTLRNPSTNAIVLFGQRRIGKTSVLLHIEQELAAKKEFTPIYFDLQDKASLPLAEVLYQMAQKLSLITKTDLPERECFDEKGTFFREAFIPTAVKTGKSQGLVLLLDEFDILDVPQQEQAGATFFPYLRDWMKLAEGIQFVFVLGRRPEELSTDTLSAFKAIRSRRVSLMTKENSVAIVRQSEKNDTLLWSDEAMERVWHWTQGHPYFTQLLCSEIWETALTLNDIKETVRPEPVEGSKPPTVNAEGVDAAIDAALEQGANAFQWIWNGLPPAERIVMAAMAEAKEDHINQDELTDILNRSKVRLILRELELAPETLISWDLLRPVENAFRFAIPLLRRWVVAEKPLRRVKAELDSLEPLAESLYHSGEGFYKIGNLEEAERALRNALDVNPNHFKARLLLAQVLLGKGNPAEAVKELEPAYEFDPPSAKSGLIGALLALADTQSENDQLTTYNRILAIEPGQSAATKRKQGILRKRAEAALKKEELATALQLYQEIGDQDGINQVKTIQRKRELEEQVTLARKHEETEDWSAAIAVYEQLLAEFPEEGDWQARLKVAQTQKRLAETYTRALTALEKNDKKLAQTLFGKIIGVQPDYKDALRYLIVAIKDIDINMLLRKNREATAKIKTLENQQELAAKRKQRDKIKWITGFLMAVILVVISILLAITAFRGWRTIVVRPAPTPTVVPTTEPTKTPVVAPTATPITTPTAPEEWSDMKFVWIEGGCFQMGSPESEQERHSDEGPVHEVCVDGFWIGKTEVTNKQYRTWKPGHDSRNYEGHSLNDDNQPVVHVSWEDAKTFAKWLTEKHGNQYTFRLPTEAEWEYAARAGTTTARFWGDDPNDACNYANVRDKTGGREFSWEDIYKCDDGYAVTAPVGSFSPNPFGLYDMLGNVWEWCEDIYSRSVYSDPQRQNPLNTSGGSERVLRGGSWDRRPGNVRCATRYGRPPVLLSVNFGFRLVRTD